LNGKQGSPYGRVRYLFIGDEILYQCSKLISLPGLDIQGGSFAVFITPAVVGLSVAADSDITFIGPGTNNTENSTKNITVTDWKR